MKDRFSEEQIIGVLKEVEVGMKVAEACRKHGISEATYYNWKAKFGGMSIGCSTAQSIGKRERQAQAFTGGIDAGYCRVERYYWPKVVSPQARRDTVTSMMASPALGVTRAGGLIGISRLLYRYA